MKVQDTARWAGDAQELHVASISIFKWQAGGACSRGASAPARRCRLGTSGDFDTHAPSSAARCDAAHSAHPNANA